MRLICPNCEAQYDVSDEAIPPGGRDVQCSNCQQSWFQTEKPTVAGREISKLLRAKLPDAIKKTSSAADAEAEAESGKDANDAAPQRQELDGAVASILREEAKRSGALPGSQTSKPPATQAEGPSAPVDANETLQRIAQMTQEEGGTPTGASKAAIAAAATGANVRSIPDIHEINAALRARAEASDTSGLNEKEKREAAERGGFRRGFFFILILCAILVLPYIFADQITENLPQTTSYMSTYVTTIDQLRLQLSEFIASLTSG